MENKIYVHTDYSPLYSHVDLKYFWKLDVTFLIPDPTVSVFDKIQKYMTKWGDIIGEDKMIVVKATMHSSLINTPHSIVGRHFIGKIIPTMYQIFNFHHDPKMIHILAYIIDPSMTSTLKSAEKMIAEFLARDTFRLEEWKEKMKILEHKTLIGLVEI